IITPAGVDGAEFIIGQLIVEELRKLGLKGSSVRSYSGSVHSEKWERGQFDISSQWVCNVSWDPNQLFSALQSRWATDVGTNAVGRNQVRMRNAKLDELSQRLQTMDPESAEA